MWIFQKSQRSTSIAFLNYEYQLNQITIDRKIQARIQTVEGTGSPDPAGKSQSYRVSQQYLDSGSPRKSRSYQASIQFLVIIGPPAKRHLNGVLLAGRGWPTFSGIWIPSSTKKKLSELDSLWQNFLDPRMK